MSSKRPSSYRTRSASGGDPPPEESTRTRHSSSSSSTSGSSSSRTVMSKLRSKLTRQRSSQREHGGDDHKQPYHPPLIKSSTLPTRMVPDDKQRVFIDERLRVIPPDERPRVIPPWGGPSLEDSPTDDDSIDSGLDPRGGDSTDSSPHNQRVSSIYDEISVQRAFGPAMKDIGRWYVSRGQYMSVNSSHHHHHARSVDDENERLGSRPPLPLPTVPLSERSVATVTNNDPMYGRIESRLMGVNGLELGLRDLAQHGWYWGPMTRVEAEERLTGYSDGTFLVRDSSDDRYLLSLSFRSQGKTLHTRIEFCNGHFSFYSFPDSENEGYTSVAELIQRSMQYSSLGVFCFSRARTTGSPAVPVRLLKPLSRFTQLRTLQHYCRFVIRQAIRFDSIRSLPLPRHVHTFLEQSQF